MKKITPKGMAISIAVIIAVITLWTTSIFSGQPRQDSQNITDASANVVEKNLDKADGPGLSEEENPEDVLLVPEPEI